jgi:ABC-2 type transport system permease protein
MKEFRTLKFLDLFQFLFSRFGINYPIMRKILTVKLTMDGRRVPTIFNQQGRKKKKRHEENGFIKSLGMYVFLSLMLIPLIVFGENYLYQMSIFFGIVMFLVMTSMISDFSNVLLDVRDRGILGTKPIDKRTIQAAKTIHICIYLFFLTAAITIIPIVVGTITHGIIFLLLSLAGILLIDLLIVVFTALIYYFILRFFDGEKLKDIINYVQIGLSITIAVGYQVLARSFSLIDLKITYSPSWWQFFIPPFWFSAPYEVLLHHKVNSYLLLFSLMALLIPVIAMIVYSKMMPSFERNLAKFAGNGGRIKPVHHQWNYWLTRILCGSKEEKAFYRFSQNMIRNEREFRLKVYPALGLSLVFPFIFMFNELQMDSYAHLAASKWYLSIYMSTMMIPNAINMLKYSGKYKGAFIYKTAPLKNLAPLYSATLKAFLANLYLPIFLILSFIFLFMFGLGIIPDLLDVFVTAILYTVICSHFLKERLPFSESFEDIQETGSWKILLALLLIGIFLGVHYAFTFIPFGAVIYFIVLLAVTIFVWKLAYRTIWNY